MSPIYRVLVLKSPEETEDHPESADEGSFEEWTLPWARLVYGQLLDYQREGEEKPGRWMVKKVAKDPKGTYYQVAPHIPLLKGGDPKKMRTP
ncbi:MAG TPA: hypothetical protein ENK02_00955 [Planctomycetes bacterium]|nr:hypothetical protein [Planctomycetota bacterium]